jgi:serine/threonine protein kinase
MNVAPIKVVSAGSSWCSLQHRPLRYTTKTPWHGTDVFKPPSFFYTDEFKVKTDGYDPAAWDVWSLGTVLLYIVGGATLYAKLRGDVYRFFEVTMQVRPKNASEGLRWDQKRKKVGSRCLFYSTDKTGRPNKMDARGIPIVPTTKKVSAVGGHNPPGGIPTNEHLWKFLPELDPDCKRTGLSTFSHELKDLLNRMLDVDPERRITIEDVCLHPWLQSHQSHGDAAVVETADQRQLFMSEMHRRFEKYINKQSGQQDVKVSLTPDQTVEFLTR